ncbi:MAG: SdpI family protein, partial [Bacteroidia bacterium]|nr:SdpI family protein [Bacteroidia bacterium]
SKSELLLVVILLPAFIYALFMLIPLIDPKKKINLMGAKYESFKNILIGFMSFLLILILYSAKNESFSNPNWIFIAIGILFIVLGNFFKTIRPNYFMGIKTPWTLENETVWKDTHVLGGKIWFIGGIVITLASMVLNSKVNVIVFLIITGILILVPVIFSYLRFQEIDKKGLS